MMYVVINSTISLFLGILLDLLIGDPKGWYHPVMAIGWLITNLENFLRGVFPKTKMGERMGGCLLAVLVVSISTLFPALFLILCYNVHAGMGILAETVMCASMLAAKSLRTESMNVGYALEQQGLHAGRNAVSMIVGRDTQKLDEAGVVKAAVETVAENTSDGVVAPLLFMLFFGAVGGFFYKSINTMDSMVGYKNEKYQYFGTAAAKLDDFANIVPARVSAIMMIAACGFCGMDMQGALQVFLRDRRNHESPNSAQTESVMAGALRVQLAGDAWYFGKKHTKPTIGDDIRSIEIGDIKRSNRLMYGTLFLTGTVVLAGKCGVILCCL